MIGLFDEKREYLNFFRIKNVLDLNFELLNNQNRIKTFDFLLETCM